MIMRESTDHALTCSIQSLQGLHKKIKLTDTNLDRGVELTSTRSAWNELRDNVERGALNSTHFTVPSANVFQRHKPDKHL